MNTPTNWELDSNLHKQHYFTGPTLSGVAATVSEWAAAHGVGIDDSDDNTFATGVDFTYDTEFGWSATVTYFSETQLGRV